MFIVPTVLKLVALPFLNSFRLLKMRKDLPPYSSACQCKTSQHFYFCSPSFKLLAHVWPLFLLRSISQELVLTLATLLRGKFYILLALGKFVASIWCGHIVHCVPRPCAFVLCVVEMCLISFLFIFKLTSADDWSGSSMSYTTVFLQSCLYVLNQKNFLQSHSCVQIYLCCWF